MSFCFRKSYDILLEANLWMLKERDMDIVKKCMLCMVFCFLGWNVFAANNPIGWTVSRAFHDPILNGRSDLITYTFVNNLPFKLVQPIVILKKASPASEYTFDDQCTGKRLNPQERCSVFATLSPLMLGKTYLQLIITGFDHNIVPLPELVTNVINGGLSDVAGTVSTALPPTMQQGSSANYTFTFKNVGDQPATNIVVTSNQSASPTYATDCGTSLAQGATCTVGGTFSAVQTGPQSVTVNFSYAQGNPIALATSTTVSGAPHGVFFTAQPGLAPIMQESTQQSVTFLLHNESGSSVTLSANLSDNVIVTPGTATFTPAGAPGSAQNNCTTGLVLANQAACQLVGTYAAGSTPGSGSISLSMPYTGTTGSPATFTTQTEIVAEIPDRTFVIENNCGFTVWFSLNGASTTKSCPCATGSTCNTGNNTCYWTNYGPGTHGSYELAHGDSTTVTLPDSTIDAQVFWSGNISASTLCSGSTCQQAACDNNGGTTACAPGIGFSQPATQAEITMNKTQNDSYDVEVINGYHLPVSMTPYYTPTTVATPDNYTCGVPGAGTAQNGFGACNWANNTGIPGNGYYWVTSGGSDCNISSPSCSTSGQICGLTTTFQQKCGNFLGYWTANQVCGSVPQSDTTLRSYFHCDEPLPEAKYGKNRVLYDLMKCSVPTGDTSPEFNTCYATYSSGDVSTCCGCIDWWTISGIESNPNTDSCGSQTNATWNNQVQNNLNWMKRNCPSSYVYPFDDKTSGFSCTNNLPNETNTTSYKITFCPNTGNPATKDGKPAGLNEGRG